MRSAPPRGARVGDHRPRSVVAPLARPRSLCGVSGGVKPRTNGEQRVAESTRCRAGCQAVASRQAASRRLRCAPALRVTRRNRLTQGHPWPKTSFRPFLARSARTRRFGKSTPTSCVRHLSALFRSHQHGGAESLPCGGHSLESRGSTGRRRRRVRMTGIRFAAPARSGPGSRSAPRRNESAWACTGGPVSFPAPAQTPQSNTPRFPVPAHP